MTQLHAAPAMTTLAEAIHLDAPNGVLNAVVLTVGRFAVPIEVLPVLRTVVRIEVLEAVQIASSAAVQIASSAAVRCWRRRNRGCPSPQSPKG